MNIQEFSSSLITTPGEGKSIINVLIGMSPTGPNVLDALLALYDSYPDSVKSNKKAFSETFFKMFKTYGMEEKHLPYYREFSKIWKPDELTIIKNKYSALLANEEKQSFKNSREFAKALKAVDSRENRNAGFDFIENNLDILAPIIKKNPNKFIDNLVEFDCWEGLVYTDYSQFKSVCNKLNINFISVLKKEFVESFYGCKYLINKTDDNSLVNVFQDIKNMPDFFEGGAFFSDRHEKSKGDKRYQINVFESLISLLIDGKHNSFYYLMKNFPTQIAHCMDTYFYEQEQVNILNTEHWEKAIKNMETVSKRYNSGEFFSEYEFSRFKEKINNNFKIIDTILLEQELPLSDVSKQKKIKI
jgi:hypothetical protein